MFFKKDPPGYYIETIHKEYKEKDPVLFNLDDFTWTRDLEAKSDKIIECLKPVLADDFKGLSTNPEDRFQFPPKIWKGFTFCFNGFKFKKHLKEYPYLAEELKKIPHLVTASVSVLEPGSRLLPHNGNSNGVMRYHLGLNVPAPMPECGFIIGGQELSWENGKAFMFCNMNVHSAHNLTNKRRHILLLDVVRPEFVPIKKKICVHTISRIMTNTTADWVRKKIGYTPQKVKQDPTKEELKYVANKTYAREEELTFLQKSLSFAEFLVLKFYIAVLSVVFMFKKMQ